MKSDDLILYAITDRQWLHESTLYQDVQKVLNGGATIVQYREKKLKGEAVIEEARALKNLCTNYGVSFIINDNVPLAKEINADGVHVGQEDMSSIEARKMLGKDKIIGVSVQTVKQALLAQKHGADYLGVGAIFTTKTKGDATPVSYATLCAICHAVTIPVVAIGGIHKDNIMELKGSGIRGVALISAILNNENIEQATKDIKKQIQDMLEEKGL